MRSQVPYTVLGLALVAGAPSANAQTLITRDIVNPQPLVTVAAETVQTTQTVRTVRHVRPAVRQIVTTRTVTRRFVPGPTVVAATIPAAPRPLYDVAAPAPIVGPDDDYGVTPPLYDVAAPGPVVAPGPMVAPAAAVWGSAPIIYRYVYEPNRILVIDPTTGVAVQAIPR